MDIIFSKKVCHFISSDRPNWFCQSIWGTQSQYCKCWSPLLSIAIWWDAVCFWRYIIKNVLCIC